MSILPESSIQNGRLYRVMTRDQRILGERIRVASGFGSRLRGLLGTRDLPAGHGLWIVPCQSVHMFFMCIPLDVVFLDENGTVVVCYRNLRPWRVTRLVDGAVGALELPAGTLDAFDVQKGDVLQFEEIKGSS